MSTWQETVADCARASFNDEMPFPAIVARLIGAGVERYHVDYTRSEITYYLPAGPSHVVVMDEPVCPIAQAFDAAAVASAVKQSQRQEHTYRDFLRKTMQAGCVGYLAQLTGRRVLYLGRLGDCHVEYFPGSAPVDAPAMRPPAAGVQAS